MSISLHYWWIMYVGFLSNSTIGSSRDSRGPFIAYLRVRYIFLIDSHLFFLSTNILLSFLPTSATFNACCSTFSQWVFLLLPLAFLFASLVAVLLCRMRVGICLVRFYLLSDFLGNLSRGKRSTIPLKGFWFLLVIWSLLRLWTKSVWVLPRFIATRMKGNLLHILFC